MDFHIKYPISDPRLDFYIDAFSQSNDAFPTDLTPITVSHLHQLRQAANVVKAHLVSLGNLQVKLEANMSMYTTLVGVRSLPVEIPGHIFQHPRNDPRRDVLRDCRQGYQFTLAMHS